MLGIPPNCARLAEKSALLHLRLFPRLFSSHATECSGIVGDETSVCRFKIVPTWVIANRLAHARQTRLSSWRLAYPILSYPILSRVVSWLFSMFSGEFCLRLKPYLTCWQVELSTWAVKIRNQPIQKRACPCDNSSPVQARATKFGSEVLNTLVKTPVVLGVDWAWHVKFNLFSKSCLFASLLRLWNICETCKKRMKRSLFHILNSYAHICSPTETCHGPWNSRVVSLVWPLLASQSLTRRLAMDFCMLL